MIDWTKVLDHSRDHMAKCRLDGIRMQWMRLLGFSDAEIKTSLKNDSPISLEEEQKQLEAAQRLSEI